jgi:hypothetical protein
LGSACFGRLVGLSFRSLWRTKRFSKHVLSININNLDEKAIFMQKRFHDVPRTKYLLALSLICGLVLLVGCGKSGPKRYDISGKVTYGGEPIPAGSVTFIPSGENQGPAGTAIIENGSFDTGSNGTGHVGGTHRVVITGLGGAGGDEFFPDGKPLFQDYEIEIELPEKETTKNFEVPGDLEAPEPSGSMDHGP